jgi:hypothetical protein
MVMKDFGTNDNQFLNGALAALDESFRETNAIPQTTVTIPSELILRFSRLGFQGTFAEQLKTMLDGIDQRAKERKLRQAANQSPPVPVGR